MGEHRQFSRKLASGVLGTSPFWTDCSWTGTWGLRVAPKDQGPLKWQGGCSGFGWELGIFSGSICRVLNTHNTGSLSLEGTLLTTSLSPGVSREAALGAQPAASPGCSFCLCGETGSPKS